MGSSVGCIVMMAILLIKCAKISCSDNPQQNQDDSDYAWSPRKSAHPISVQIECNATLSNSTLILDDVEDINKISCGSKHVVLSLEPGSNSSAVTEQFSNGTIIHGGPDWGCKDRKKKNAPFYYKVTDVQDMGNGVVTVAVEPVSPFFAFNDLSWVIQSTPSNQTSSAPTSASTRSNDEEAGNQDETRSKSARQSRLLSQI